MPDNKNLKPGWKIWRFDQIAKNISERAEPTPDDSALYVGLEHMDSGSLRIRRWGSQTDLVGTKLRVRQGDIIFARRNAYLKRVAIAPHDGLFSAHGMVLRAKSDVVLPEFLPFFMQSDLFMDRAIEISVGSLSPTINWKTLAAQEFPLPSLDEQSEIVKVLNAAENQTEALIAAANRANELKRSLLKQAFSSGLRGEKTIPASVHYQSVPIGWRICNLGEVFEILDSKRVPIKDSERNERKGPYPYYGASGPIDSIDDFIFDEEILLLSEDGMNLLYRSSPVVYKVMEKCWVNNHAHVLRPKPHANIDFYAEYLESIALDPFITGTYQKKITKSDCEKIPLPLPPIDEQAEIVRHIQSINVGHKAMSARIEQSSEITKLLMKSVFGDQSNVH